MHNLECYRFLQTFNLLIVVAGQSVLLFRYINLNDQKKVFRGRRDAFNEYLSRNSVNLVGNTADDDSNERLR